MRLSDNRSIRILQVVGGMNRAGLETWLMHMLRHIDRHRFKMDFLVHSDQPCAYDDEIRTLGCQIIPCLNHSQPWLYVQNFRKILQDYGPYEIIHSHVHHFSGYVLRLAQAAGIPIRIAHSHIDTSSLEAEEGLYRRLYYTLMRRWIFQYATLGLGCSRNALANLFSPDWERDSRCQILYYGIDLNPFQLPIDTSAVRAEFGIPLDAFVIGHVARFEKQKNHAFLIDIAVELAKREPKMYLLLVGKGSLRPDIEHKVARVGLSDRVIFTGVRPDIPRLMLGAMDVLLLPSLQEGLPLVLLEAQAAGLPCIFSDEAVTKEADLLKPLMRRVSLSYSASTWADAVIETRNTLSTSKKADALTIFERSPFNMHKGLAKLTTIYSSLGAYRCLN